MTTEDVVRDMRPLTETTGGGHKMTIEEKVEKILNEYRVRVIHGKKMGINSVQATQAILELMKPMKNEIEKLRVQLAGCGVVALGYATDKNDCK